MMGEAQRERLEVTVKEVSALKVASVEAAGSREEIARVLMDLFRWVLTQGLKVVSYPMVLFPDPEAAGSAEESRFSACVPVDPAAKTRGADQVAIRDLPALRVASARHRGAPGGAARTAKEIAAWALANGYKPSGPVREIYLVNPLEGSGEDMFVEIQMPVTAVRH